MGRDLELERVKGFVAGIPGGSRSLEIGGPAGMGKTVLWRRAVADAEAEAFTVLSARPLPAETVLSFAGLSDLLGAVVDEVGPHLPAPQRAALDVALLRTPAEGAPPDPRSVATASLNAIRWLATRGPVLVAVDDRQWLDRPTGDVVEFCRRRLGDERVGFLETRRVQPGAGSGGDGPTDDGIVRLEVKPLSPGALHELLRDRFGRAFPRPTLIRIHETSGGNPYYALEIARVLTERAGEPDEHLEPGRPLPVPESLLGILRERVDGLAVPVRRFLEAAAIVSDPTVELAGTASGAAGRASDRVRSATRAGVIEPDGDRIRFSHPLLAEVVLAGMGPEERRALHRRVADLVPRAEERARHLALGADGPSAEIAAVVHEAARAAAARGAIAPAAELAEEAIALTPADDPERFRRRLDASAYEVRGGDIAGARQHLEPLTAPDVPGPVRAAALLRMARMGEESPTTSLQLCLQAIAEAGGDPLEAEGHQLAAEMSMLSGDVPHALEHARRAVELAERVGEPAMLIESLGTLCHYETYTGAITPGLLEGALELERAAPRPSNNYSPREILGLRLMYSDRLDEARDLLEASLDWTAEIGDELDRNSLLIHLTQLECRAGRPVLAARHAKESRTISEQTGGWALAAPLFAESLAAAHLGEVAASREAGERGLAIAEAGGSGVFRVLNRWALGFLALSQGDAAEADRLLRDLPDDVEAMGYRNPGVRPVHADAIEARIGAGDLAVDGLIHRLEERGRSLDNPWALAGSARCRGLLLAARGDPDGAMRELERALTEHERSPQPLERGRTLLALGTLQRRSQRRRDARTTLVAAVEVFDEIGAAIWAERARAELGRIGGRTSSGTDLTGSERRVAELAADGMTNREVAEALYLSEHTVESHLSSAYRKLGVRSRTELAAKLER
ncbi:MAG TPA: LuxR C-terminal-related transcriptional regulator [Actinomycetota bacterium]